MCMGMAKKWRPPKPNTECLMTVTKRSPESGYQLLGMPIQGYVGFMSTCLESRGLLLRCLIGGVPLFSRDIVTLVF